MNQNVSIDVMVNLSRFQGRVYINGVGLGQVQDWYACKIGYVLQLAVPYYEELSVRQNLFFAAHMRLPKGTCISDKYERVEQIIAEVSNFKKNAYRKRFFWRGGGGGGETSDKKLPIRVITVEFVYYRKTSRRLFWRKMYSSNFLKFYIIIYCCENIYCRYCIQNSLPLSSLGERVLYFMLSRLNKLDRDFLYRRI